MILAMISAAHVHVAAHAHVQNHARPHATHAHALTHINRVLAEWCIRTGN